LTLVDGFHPVFTNSLYDYQLERIAYARRRHTACILEKLHHIICSGEMRALTSYGSGAAERLLAPYKRFFPLTVPDDEEENHDDLQDNIVEVLELIMGTSSSDGAIGSIVESLSSTILVSHSQITPACHYPENSLANHCLQTTTTNTQKQPTRKYAAPKEPKPTPVSTTESATSKQTASRKSTPAQSPGTVPSLKPSSPTAKETPTPTPARKWTPSPASPYTE
jgi:hypothetical protein